MRSLESRQNRNWGRLNLPGLRVLREFLHVRAAYEGSLMISSVGESPTPWPWKRFCGQEVFKGRCRPLLEGI